MATQKTLVNRVTKKEPTIRIPVPLRQSIAKQLDLYKEFYEQVYEEPVEVRELMANMLETVMNKDKAFQTFLKNQPTRATTLPTAPAAAIQIETAPHPLDDLTP